MKTFLGENFLLSNDTAVELYHHYAKDMPIIDYHCHLSPQEIYENKRFRNLTEVWLYGDHYKWRLMRANGIDEQYITGQASDSERFLAWARTVPLTMGNPVYLWSHLELQRYFGVRELINEQTASVIWQKVNHQLQEDRFGARDLIQKFNVKVVCTTDDPTDSLEYHLQIKEIKDFETAVLPSFRPDKGLEINRSTFVPWVHKLSQVSGRQVGNYDEFLEAIEKRAQFFHSVGGRVSDHALDFVPYAQTTKEETADIFQKALSGQSVTSDEENKYKTYTLLFFGGIYAKLGWVMQFHINASRNNNTAMFAKLGPDTGFDSINDSSVSYPLVRLLDHLER
jgi:glucuronate isomerase